MFFNCSTSTNATHLFSKKSKSHFCYWVIAQINIHSFRWDLLYGWLCWITLFPSFVRSGRPWKSCDLDVILLHYWRSHISFALLLSSKTVANDFCVLSSFKNSMSSIVLNYIALPLSCLFPLFFLYHSTQISTREDAVRHLPRPVNKEICGPSCSVFRWRFGPQSCCWNLTGTFIFKVKTSTKI